jgi:hypothetical protein
LQRKKVEIFVARTGERVLLIFTMMTIVGFERRRIWPLSFQADGQTKQVQRPVISPRPNQPGDFAFDDRIRLGVTLCRDGRRGPVAASNGAFAL